MRPSRTSKWPSASPNSERSPREKLRVLIQRLFDSYERHYPYLYVYVQEDMSRLLTDKSSWSNKMRALNHRFDVAVVSIIQEGLDRGIFKSAGDAKLLAAGVVGVCNWSHRWFEPSRKYRAADIANVFADMVIDGLSK